MKRSCAVAVMSFVVGLAQAQVGVKWLSHSQYSPSYSNQYMVMGRVMAVDAWGNVLVCAHGQYNRSSTDFIVQKYDAGGSLVWSVNYDGGEDIAYGIAVDDSGAVFVTGRSIVGSASVVRTVKWRRDGVLAWARSDSGDVRSSYNCGNALAVRNGAVYVAGMLYYQTSKRDFSLIRLDAATGARVWARTISRSPAIEGSEQALDVMVDAAGRIMACGQTYTTGRNGLTPNSDATFACYDTAGTQLWAEHYDSEDANETVRRLCVRGSLVAGTGYTVQSGNSNLLVLAFGVSGTPSWQQVYNGTGSGADYGYDVGIDQYGDVYVCGSSYSSGTSYDMVTLKYSGAGTPLWTRLLDIGRSTDGAYALHVEDAGGVTVAGFSYVPGSSASSMTAQKYGVSGTTGWTFLFQPPGSSGSNTAFDIVSGTDGVLIAGMGYWGFPNYYDPTVIRLEEVPDVGVNAILAPSGTKSPGSPVTPRADVRNYSLKQAAFGCRFTISDGYRAETTLVLGPGDSILVDFPTWYPASHGFWQVSCSTAMALDYNHLNDSAFGTVYVSGPATDAGVRSVAVPGELIRYQEAVLPAGRWHNFGTAPVTVTAYMFINRETERLYAQSKQINLAPDGRDTLVEFPAWVGDRVGYFTARCSTALAGDGAAVNDTVSLRFGVVNTAAGQWLRLQDLPAGRSGRPVSKGGCLAGDGSMVYALKGNKTNEVYAYNVRDDSWCSLPELPAGLAGKPVAAGGAICADGLGGVYACRGNRTDEFYRLDPVLGWLQLPGVPVGSANSTLRGGTGMRFVVLNDTGYVYLLKGSGTDEFYRYNVVSDTWQTLECAPAGQSGKTKYKDGSALALGSDSLLHCLKAKYNEVFTFDLAPGAWRGGQTNVPFVGTQGRNRKVKGGGSATVGDGLLTVLKGGGSFEFWKLDGADSVWREYPPVPPGDRNKKVKDGAGLEYCQGRFFALKGGKTGEFWAFTPTISGGQMAAGSLHGAGRALPSAASVVRDMAQVELYQTLKPGVEFRISDMSGRVVISGVAGRDGLVSQTRSDLPSGVYVMRACVPGVLAKKFVVVR